MLDKFSITQDGCKGNEKWCRAEQYAASAGQRACAKGDGLRRSWGDAGHGGSGTNQSSVLLLMVVMGESIGTMKYI